MGKREDLSSNPSHPCKIRMQLNVPVTSALGLGAEPGRSRELIRRSMYFKLIERPFLKGMRRRAMQQDTQIPFFGLCLHT